MPPPVATLLHLPGETHRELWKLEPAGGVWTRVEGSKNLRDDSSRAVQGVETIALDSSPFFALQANGDASSIEQSIALRWEALGLETDLPGKHWTRWEVAQEGSRLLIGTLALNLQELSEEILHHTAQAFEPSVLIYPYPADHLIIFLELGRYVAVFTRGRQVLHACVLSSRQLDDHAVIELRQIYQSLQSSLLLPAISGIQLWTQTEVTFATNLQQALGQPVHIAPKPAPRLPSYSSGLLPAVVALERAEHEKKRRNLRLLTLVLSLVAFAYLGWAGAVLMREYRLNQQLTAIQQRQPEVENARFAQMRWSALEDAISPDLSPVEVFHQIVSLLPPEGIRFKEFSMNQDKVVISGEATSLIHASKFQADIKASKNLKRYTFTAPQPTIMDDNRASFRIEGTLNQGGELADAAQ